MAPSDKSDVRFTSIDAFVELEKKELISDYKMVKE